MTQRGGGKFIFWCERLEERHLKEVRVPAQVIEEGTGKPKHGEEGRELASLWWEGRDAKPPVRSVTRQGQAGNAILAKKVMRWVNCEREKGQVRSVEKKGDISEALQFAWQKARPSRCRVRGTCSVSSKEDLSQDNPDHTTPFPTCTWNKQEAGVDIPKV